MNLKGKAKITIKNADGTVAFHEEHENTITPALANILTTNMSGTIDFTKITPIMTELLGGVACWNGTVSDSAIFLPKQENAKLTAIAGQGNCSDNGARGSKVSGGVVKNGNDVVGYRWTWSWLQNQGVGRITDVSLIHKDVGDAYNQAHASGGLSLNPVEDISNYIIDANDYTYSAASPLPSAMPCPVGISDLKTIPIGFYNDYNHVVSIELVEDSVASSIYGGDWRTGHINVYISKFTGTGLWIWNNIGDLVEESKIEIRDNLVWQQANRNQTGRGIFYIAYDDDIKHLYVIWGGSIQTYDPAPTPPYSFDWYPWGQELHYIDCDLTTGKQSKKTLALNDHLCYDFRFHTNTYEPIQLKVVDGCIIMPMYYIEPLPNDFVLADEAEVGARIDLRNTAILDYVEGYLAEVGENAISFTGQCNLGNSRSMFPDAVIEKRQATENIQLEYFLDSEDPQTGIRYRETRNVDSAFYSDAIPRNNSLFSSANHQNRSYCASMTNGLIQFHTLFQASGTVLKRLRGATLNKMYCATKYHLEDTANKNSTQTMTVEYELLQGEASET